MGVKFMFLVLICLVQSLKPHGHTPHGSAYLNFDPRAFAKPQLWPKSRPPKSTNTCAAAHDAQVWPKSLNAHTKHCLQPSTLTQVAIAMKTSILTQTMSSRTLPKPCAQAEVSQPVAENEQIEFGQQSRVYNSVFCCDRSRTWVKVEAFIVW